MPETNILKANFKIRGSSTAIPVHFNPESLQYVITNNLKNTGRGASAKQYVSDSTGKLTMELIYDTTDTGEDVRLHTVRVAELMEPSGSGTDRTPPVVEFEWGLYTFAGMVESYKEKLDFFSSDGIPLRASLNLTLSSQDDVFEGGSDARRANTGGLLGGGSPANNVQTPPPNDDDGRGVTQTATQGGNPAAARDIAAQNGLESMRFTGSSPLELNASGSLGGASSLSAGINVGVQTGAAFTGLHTSAGTSAGGGLNLDNFLSTSGTAQLGTEVAGAFALGGQVQLQGGASLKADVGKAGELKARIEFDGGE